MRLICLAAASMFAVSTPPASAQNSPACGGIQDLGTLGGTQLGITGISADGRTVVGSSSSPNGVARAMRWTPETGLIELPGMPGWSITRATGVSADGSITIGYHYFWGDALACRWVAGRQAPEPLDTVIQPHSFANAITPDGSVIAGSWTSNSRLYQPALWHGATIQPLGTISGSTAEATVISADGTVIAGDERTPIQSAFRWSSESGFTSLGTFPNALYSHTVAISADGSTIIGDASLSGYAGRHAFRWTDPSSGGAGLVDLGTLGGARSQARAISADGSVIVGDAETAAPARSHAFMWTAASGMIDLDTLGGFSSPAAISANGAVVVGTWWSAAGGPMRAFRWTAATGMQDLGSPGPGDCRPRVLSADSRVLAGQWIPTSGPEHAFRWSLPIVIDLNADGFIDFLDFAAFAEAFDSGSPPADINSDGVIDSYDADAFVSAFDHGC